MKLEQQVTSLELSKRLKELGVKQESLFWWQEKWKTGRTCIVQTPTTGGDNDEFKWYPAFTVAELGEMLPEFLLIGGYSHNLEIVRSAVWRFYYGDPLKHGIDKCAFFTAGNDDTEADARAKCLIYLIENGLMEGYEKVSISGNTHGGRGGMGQAKKM